MLITYRAIPMVEKESEKTNNSGKANKKSNVANHPVYGYQTANDYSYGSVKEHIRKNRAFMTEAERLLWNELKNDKLGLHFRRQHIIGDYIVDFVCLKCKLIVEVDGDYHGEVSQVDYDAYRAIGIFNRGVSKSCISLTTG